MTPLFLHAVRHSAHEGYEPERFEPLAFRESRCRQNQGHVSSPGRYALRPDTGSKRDYQWADGVWAFDWSDWGGSKCPSNGGSLSAAYVPATSDLLASVRYSAMSFL